MIGRAVVVDVVGFEHRAGEFLQQVGFFVGEAIAADDADGVAAADVAHLAQLPADGVEGDLPGDGFELARGRAQERGGDAIIVICEVEGVAALVAEEVAVHAGFVAVVAAHDLRAVGGGADAERGFAAIAAVGADGGDMIHLPGAGFVAVGAAGERADRAGVDAHAALLTVDVGEVIFAGRRRNVWGDHRRAAAVLDAEREDVHAFAAHAHAAIAEDAARAVEVDDGRPLLLFAMVFGLGVEGVGGAVLEGHVLQFALAAGVADGAVERVVAEQELERGLARLGDFRGFGRNDHALGDGGGAGRLQLGHLLDAHDAHATGRLQAEAGVITEGRDIDAGGFAGFDEEGARRGGDFLSVYGKGYVWHIKSLCFRLPNLVEDGGRTVAKNVISVPSLPRRRLKILSLLHSSERQMCKEFGVRLDFFRSQA